MVKHFSFRRTLVQRCYGRGFNGLVFSDMYLISSYRISKEGINMHVKIILLFLCFFQVNSCPSGQRRRQRPANGLPPRQENNYQTPYPPYNQVDHFLQLSLQYGPHFLCWITGVVPFNTWLISSWEENNCCYKLSNWQNDNYFHSKWQLQPFWGK